MQKFTQKPFNSPFTYRIQFLHENTHLIFRTHLVRVVVGVVVLVVAAAVVALLIVVDFAHLIVIDACWPQLHNQNCCAKIPKKVDKCTEKYTHKKRMKTQSKTKIKIQIKLK